jgi:hypothetical protein
MQPDICWARSRGGPTNEIRVWLRTLAGSIQVKYIEPAVHRSFLVQLPGPRFKKLSTTKATTPALEIILRPNLNSFPPEKLSDMFLGLVVPAGHG